MDTIQTFSTQDVDLILAGHTLENRQFAVIYRNRKDGLGLRFVAPGYWSGEYDAAPVLIRKGFRLNPADMPLGQLCLFDAKFDLDNTTTPHTIAINQLKYCAWLGLGNDQVPAAAIFYKRLQEADYPHELYRYISAMAILSAEIDTNTKARTLH